MCFVVIVRNIIYLEIINEMPKLFNNFNFICTCQNGVFML